MLNSKSKHQAVSLFCAFVLCLGIVACDEEKQTSSTEAEPEQSKTADGKKAAEPGSQTEGSGKKTENSADKEPNVLDRIELGMSPDAVREEFGKPSKESGFEKEKPNSGALRYEGKPADKLGFQVVGFAFGPEGLTFVQFTEPMEGSAPRSEFETLSRKIAKGLGEPVEYGLEWNINSDFDESLVEAMDIGGANLAAIWEEDTKTVLLGVGLDSRDESDQQVNVLLLSEPKDESGKSMREQAKLLPFPGKPWLREEFSVNGMAYRVSEVALVETVGDGHAAEEASDGAYWIRVDYSVENVGRSTKTVETNRIAIMDSENRVFTPSSRGMTAMTMSEGQDIVLSQFQPGIPKDQVAVFEVPRKAAEDFLLVFPKPNNSDSDRVAMPFGWPRLGKEDNQ